MKKILIHFDPTHEGMVEDQRTKLMTWAPADHIFGRLLGTFNNHYQVEFKDNYLDWGGEDDPPNFFTLVITYDDDHMRSCFSSNEVCQGGITIPTRMMMEVASPEEFDRYVIERILAKIRYNASHLVALDTITTEIQ